MNYQEIITAVRDVAGDTNVLQFTDSTLKRWIEQGMREACIQNNLLQISANTPTVAGTYQYVLPADILKLHSVKYNNSKVRILTLEEFDEQFPEVDLTTKGSPHVAYIWSGQINLHPAPDAAKTLRIEYLKDPGEVPADLNTECPLPVGYHTRVIDYCLAQVAQQDDDMNRYQIKMQEFLTGVKELKDQPEYSADLYPFISVADRDFGDEYGVSVSQW